MAGLVNGKGQRPKAKTDGDLRLPGQAPANLDMREVREDGTQVEDVEFDKISIHNNYQAYSQKEHTAK
eukprot:10598158-Heterocapsa_arctica.AAC.1